jgi:hypothetical protein
MYPLGAAALAFIEMVNLRKYAILFFALFLGLLAYIAIPLIDDDSVRHFAMFELFRNLKFRDIISNSSFLQRGILFYSLSYVLSQLGFSKQILPFLSTFIFYFLLLKITIRVIQPKALIRTRLVSIVIILCIINFTSVMVGIRNHLAISLMVYGVFVLLREDNKAGWFFVLLACGVHSSVIMYVVFLLIAFLLPEKRLVWLKTAVYISLAFYFANYLFVSTILESLIVKLVPGLQSLLSDYVSGYWARGFIRDLSFNGLVFKNLQLVAYFFAIYYLLRHTRPDSRFVIFIYISVLFCNLLFTLPVVFGRFSVLPKLFIYLIVIEDYCKRNRLLNTGYINKYLIVVLLTFLLRIYSFRYTIIESYPKMLSQSSLSVLFTDIKKSDYIKK